MSSSVEVTPLFTAPLASLQYRDIADGDLSGDVVPGGMEGRESNGEGRRRAEVEMSEAQLAARIRQERAEAVQEAQQKLHQELEKKLAAARGAIAVSVREFAVQRDEYFARVEAEVVQLALSIAARILHREVQVDPMLVASLVRIAMEKIREGSSVTVRVAAGRAQSWTDLFRAQPPAVRVEVVEDAALSEGDCILESELGSANFGLDAQLKEVERGFFDLLALRPAIR